MLKEFSGALGDLPLFFIFFVGFTQFSNLDPLQILFWSGVAHIIIGVVFKIPMPYQPMKAMGLYAIAHGVSQGEILAAGFASGLLILALNSLGIFEKIYNFFPKSVIRGIQVGLAIGLGVKAWELMHVNLGGIWCVFAVLFSFIFFRWVIPAKAGIYSFIILCIFGIAGLYIFPGISLSSQITWPAFHFLKFEGFQFSWTTTTLLLILIQFPLTTANSIFSPALLIRDLFPEKKISPSSIAKSVGLMNLLTCPFGGMPACHGAGGLSAQVRFGAKTGKSVMILGFLKIISAISLGGFFLTLAQGFPRFLLGVLFLFPAFDLGMRAFEVRGKLPVISFGITVFAYVFGNAAWAMLFGVFSYYALKQALSSEALA